MCLGSATKSLIAANVVLYGLQVISRQRVTLALMKVCRTLSQEVVLDQKIAIGLVKFLALQHSCIIRLLFCPTQKLFWSSADLVRK